MVDDGGSVQRNTVYVHPLAQDDYRSISNPEIRRTVRKQVEGLKRDVYPQNGNNGRAEQLVDNLRPHRALRFKTPAGDYRVLYHPTSRGDGNHHVNVLMVGPHENFYKAAIRRIAATNPNRKIQALDPSEWERLAI